MIKLMRFNTTHQIMKIQIRIIKIIILIKNNFHHKNIPMIKIITITIKITKMISKMTRNSLLQILKVDSYLYQERNTNSNLDKYLLWRDHPDRKTWANTSNNSIVRTPSCATPWKITDSVNPVKTNWNNTSSGPIVA